MSDFDSESASQNSNLGVSDDTFSGPQPSASRVSGEESISLGSDVNSMHLPLPGGAPASPQFQNSQDGAGNFADLLAAAAMVAGATDGADGAISDAAFLDLLMLK